MKIAVLDPHAYAEISGTVRCGLPVPTWTRIALRPAAARRGEIATGSGRGLLPGALSSSGHTPCSCRSFRSIAHFGHAEMDRKGDKYPNLNHLGTSTRVPEKG